MNKEKSIQSMWKSFTYRIRLFSFLMWDIIMIHFASVFSLLIRFDLVFSKVDPYYWDALLSYCIIHTAITITIFFVFHLYSSLWRYAGMEELANITWAGLCSTATQYVGIHLLGYGLPRSYFVIYPCVLTIVTAAGRFLYRFMRIIRATQNRDKKK